MKGFIGVDISKDTLDVWLLKESGKAVYKQFNNIPAGWSRLLRWVGTQGVDSVHYCMESTGAHSTGLALFLVEQNLLVSVVNPVRIKSFGIALGIINKTDKADARTIANYCQKLSPTPWRMCSSEVRQLVAYMRRYDDLQGLLTQEKNRISEPGLLKDIHRSLQQSIRFLEKQLELIKDQIRKHIDNHPDLKKDKELLESIPGIGEITAFWLLAELPDVEQFDSAKDAAAFAGLSPCERRSGTSLYGKTRISKAGNRFLRKALYMPALSAKRYNAPVKSLYDRLIAKGKHPKSALAACMRKLLMIAFGVLKSQAKFAHDTGHLMQEPLPANA